MQQLLQPQPEYHLPSLKDAVNPKLLHQHYEVTWIAEPKVDLTSKEYAQVKPKVKVKMTVIAIKGYIGKVDLLESSGLKSVDEKIKKAVLISSVQPLKGFDPNVVYELEHVIDLK
ncbi:energy transducer TonB [Acinetobacter sp. NCu2D-2]|uniref:energy transducer TonB n=1 Tax=Acinetobacter sp. NCu2D-2 TaxID=1608473 RepID=UPI0012FEE6F8|nr:energy transducer TonB [Acinetobacter sp. NCu2D-2]